MARARMFSPGRVVTSMDDLAHCISVGCWFYWPHPTQRPKHPTIIANQQFWVVMNSLRAGRIRIAVRNYPSAA